VCNCRKEIDKQMSDALKHEGKIVDFDLISGKTYSTFEFQIGKRVKEKLIIHTFCPFCGQKYFGKSGVPADDR